MANKTMSPTSAPLSYADFKPVCDLKKEEGLETLIINLPGFKTEQLKVQACKKGDLKVSGERPTSADGSRWSRFAKETKLPEGCDINDIRAKFINGRLHVIMPKKVTPSEPQVADQKPIAEAQVPDSEKVENKSNEHGKMGASGSYDQRVGDHMLDHKTILQTLKGNTRAVLGLGFGIAAVTMVAIGAFVAS